jgi:hypothetical protein
MLYTKTEKQKDNRTRKYVKRKKTLGKTLVKIRKNKRMGENPKEEQIKTKEKEATKTRKEI